jgi:hypothetical protein
MMVDGVRCIAYRWIDEMDALDAIFFARADGYVNFSHTILTK